MISHWDDVEAVRRERGHICGDWQALTGDSSDWIGVQRIRIAPGKWSTPLHLEGADEEIFFVLDGSGVSVQRIGSTDEVFRGRRPAIASSISRSSTRTRCAQVPMVSTSSRSASEATRPTHSSRARVSPGSAPRGCSRGRPKTTPGSARRTRDRRRSASSRSGRRGSSTCAKHEAGRCATERPSRARRAGDLGRAAGSYKTGIKHLEVHPGKLNNPPHCHSAEEIFVVLDGEGTVELWPHLRQGGELEAHEVHRGSVVARPAGNGRPHAFRAARDGLSVSSRSACATRRRHVLPALAEGELPRDRPHRSARRAGLLGR